MAYSRKKSLEEIQELVRGRGKKFVSIEEGALLYSLGRNTFRDMAEDAGAVYHVKRRVLINTEVFDEYLESFRDM